MTPDLTLFPDTLAPRGAAVPIPLSRFARRQPAVTRRLAAAHGTLIRVTRGRIAAQWFGAPMLLLETTGRRTGRTRQAPLVYLRDGEDLIVVPANAGADGEPHWWRNLRAAGGGVAVIGGARRPVIPCILEGAHRARLWDRFRAISPIDHYQQRTGRRLDVVALIPAPASAEPLPPRAGRPGLIPGLALRPSAS
jgi:F420H(2)-dependent quinone reductase